MSSDDEESWHNSDSGECDDEVLSSLSPSDPESDHEPPIEKQVVPPIEEQEDQPAEPCRKKRRKRKDHGPTGRPRGPPKGYKFTERKRLDAPIEADVELSDITRDPQVRERIIGLLGSVRVGRVNHRYAPEFISVHTRPVCEQDEAYLVVFGAGRE